MAHTDNAAVRFVDSHLDAGRADKPAFCEVDGGSSAPPIWGPSARFG